MRLDVQGRPLFTRNILLGQFPADYARSSSVTVLLHTGGDHDAHLVAPLIA